MVEWHSSPTNVTRVRSPDPPSYEGRAFVVCFSPGSPIFLPPQKTTLLISNRPFAAKPSRDLLFIKLWVATLRMPEMEKACRKHQNGQV